MTLSDDIIVSINTHGHAMKTVCINFKNLLVMVFIRFLFITCKGRFIYNNFCRHLFLHIATISDLNMTLRFLRRREKI